MSFISNNNPPSPVRMYHVTMSLGAGLLALSEHLQNQEGPIARIAHVASLTLSTGLILYSTRQMYNDVRQLLPRDYSLRQAYNDVRQLYNTLQTPDNLMSFGLSDNRLTSSPDLSFTLAPKTLDQSDNQRTTPSDLSHTPLPTSLDLSRNQLTTPPDLSHTPLLTSLDLSHNGLTTSPDLSHTPLLTSLDLSHNEELTTSPDLSHTPLLTSLDLSCDPLTTPPDLSHTPLLTSLDLTSNRLTTSPDLSHTPALTSLDLSRNRLTTPPDLSHTPLLTWLNLSCNPLTTSPNLSHTPALRSLYLVRYPLTTPPDLTHTPLLTSLSLRLNRLTTPPDLSYTPALIELDLSHNELTTPPDLSHTPLLTSLDLTNNELTTPPDLSHTPLFTWLNLRGNRLTISPDVSHTPLLAELHLENNRLTTLHDSILHLPRGSIGDPIFGLPRGCVVYAEGNRFSAAYVAAFQQRLQEHRLQYPDQGPIVYMSIADDNLPIHVQTLEQRLRGWSDEYEKIHPPIFGDSRPRITDTNAKTYFEPLLSLNEDDKNNLGNYLRRLRETKDYRNGTVNSKKNVILRVERMLSLACKNAEFKGQMLALINEGLTSCGDRVLITFNDIEIQWHIHQAQSEPELRNLLVRVERYEQLRKHAIQIAEERQLGDQVETILHYQIALTEQLDLPISTQGMLYQAISGVNQTMLNDARTKIASLSDNDLLSQSEHWRVYLAKKHADAISKINEKFGDLLEVAEEYYGIEDSAEKQAFLEAHADLAQLLKNNTDIIDYVSACNFINHQREAAITALGSEPTDTLYIDTKEHKEKEHKVREPE
jgi:Leucine-rich repeat (LRR) protein